MGCTICQALCSLTARPKSVSILQIAITTDWVEFDETLARVGARRSSLGGKARGQSWVQNAMSQQLTTANTINGSALKASASRARYNRSPLPNLRLTLGGPTTNMRSLAGQLLMSGSKTSKIGSSINEALLQKNSEMQASVN